MAPSSVASKKKKAPSSVAAKRPVAAKRKITVKSTSSSKKNSSIPGKKRASGAAKTTSATSSGLSNRKRKRATEQAVKKKEPVVLPADWPVTSQPPTFPRDASALKPGTLLRQACSGNDIQLARSACVVPNFEKGKGKFLLVFPGNFSFGQMLGGGSTSSNDNDDNSSNGKAGAATKTPSVEKSTPTEEVDDEKKPVAATKKAASPSGSMTMGRIEGLRTNTPSFRIPFPHLQKTLVFPGKKTATTSKYLALTCSNKKKGTVQCKSIFSSAIVFGIPKWESSTEGGDLISTPINTATMDNATQTTSTVKSETQISEDGDGAGSKISGRPFLHYGGSERTVDGATRNSRKSLNVKSERDFEKPNDAQERIPIWSNYGTANTTSSAFEFSSASTTHSNVAMAAEPFQEKKTIGSPGISSDDEEKYSDSDGSYDVKANKNSNPAGSAMKTRLPPRRQASMTKKRYVEEDDDDASNDDTDPETDENDENSPMENQNNARQVEKKVQKPLKKASRPSSLQKRKRSVGKGGKAETSTRKGHASVREVINIDDENDDNDSSSDVSEVLEKDESANTKQRRSAPKRKSRSNKKTSYKEINESDIEESNAEDDSEGEDAISASTDDDVSLPKKRRKAVRREETKKEDRSTSTTPRGRSQAVAKSTPSHKRKDAPARSKSLSASAAKKEKTRQRKSTLPKKTETVSILETVSTPSPISSPGTKSPFRRRHKKKSPANKTKTKVLDLTQDDEFAFG